MNDNAGRKKKSINLQSAVLTGIQLLGFAAAGAVIVIDLMPTYEKGRGFVFLLCMYMLVTLLFYYVSVIAHEAGHMLCGLISGYEFLSFRIGSFMLVKTDDGLKLKRFSIPGTGGQCIMKPPAYSKELPVFIYNFGGCLMNIILAAASAVLCVAFYNILTFRIMLMVFSIINAAMFISNILPLEIGVATDGRNIAMLGRNDAEKYAFWLMLYNNACILEGKEPPEELAVIPDNIDYSSYLQASAAPLVRLAWLEARGRYEEAIELTDFLLKNAALVEMIRYDIASEKLLLMAALHMDCYKILECYTPEIQKYIKSVKEFFVSKQAVLYGLSIVFDGNSLPCGVLPLEKQRLEFERVARKYPYEFETAMCRKVLKEISTLPPPSPGEDAS